MHPRILDRANAVERTKRTEIYRSLDNLLVAVTVLCRQAGLDADPQLSRQREILATIAGENRLSAEVLVEFADKLLADARKVAGLVQAAAYVSAELGARPLSFAVPDCEGPRSLSALPTASSGSLAS